MMSVKRYRELPLFNRMAMVLLLVSPILQCYGWGKYDFSFIITSLLAVIHLILHGLKNTKVPKVLFLYFGWWYLSHLLSSSSMAEFIPLGLIKILLTYIMFIDLFDLDYFIGKYKKIANVIIIYFYIQELGRILLGTHLPSVITILPIAVTEDANEFILSNIESVRSSSLFSEPAIFAQFLLPLLCYELFNNSKKRNWKNILFLIITLLWSRAGNGMIGLIAIALCFGFDIMKNQQGGRKIVLLITSLFFVIVSLNVFLKTEGGQKIRERADNIGLENSLDQGYAGSTFMRIYQGYFIFNEYSDFYKIVGNDHDDYIRLSAFKSPEMVYLYRHIDFVTYFNSFQAVLINTGIIGLLIMILFMSNIWKGNTFCGKSMLFIIIVLSFVSANYFTNVMALYLLPAMWMNKNRSITNTSYNE